jgi:hypothetical protein
MNNIFWVILAIVVISTVVGAVAKMLNNLNEMNAGNAGNRAQQGGGAGAGGGGGARGAGGGGGGAVRQSSSDMDRFLAEIDRLRKKTAEAPPPPPNQTPTAPVVQPEKRQDRPRPRVVAEVAELPKQDLGFAAPPLPTVAPVQRPGELPVATVLAPPSTTGAPATRVTRFAGRARPVAKTPFAKNLTSLLGTSQGLALAIVLQEVLGPPRSKK